MQNGEFKLVPASYLIIEKEGKVMLSLRANTGYYDGYYSLVSGHVCAEESFIQAMIREAKEEAGIDLGAQDLNVVHVMHRNEKANPPEIRYRIDLFFVADKIEGEIKNMEPEKCSGFEWFSWDGLPENIVPCVRKALENYRQGIKYSEFGFK